MRLGITCLFTISCFSIGWGAIRASDMGRDIFMSIKPLFLAISPSSTTQLREMRVNLSVKIKNLISELGPNLRHGGDKKAFEANRVVKAEDFLMEDSASLLKQEGIRNRRVASAAITGPSSDFNWTEVDADEISDDVFLFKDGRGNLIGRKTL